MSRANVKPLIHWAIARGYTMRFGERTPTRVSGVVTTSAGEMSFLYDPVSRIITLGGDSAAQPSAAQPSATHIAINEYGWEEKNP